MKIKLSIVAMIVILFLGGIYVNLTINNNGSENKIGNILESYLRKDTLSQEKVNKVEELNILEKYKLPNLERISPEESNIVNNLQVIKRIKSLKLDVESMMKPDEIWKNIYNKSIIEIEDKINFNETIDFKGNKISELNELINSNSNKNINIMKDKIIIDETLEIKSNISLIGNGVKLVVQNKVDKFININNQENIKIEGFNIDNVAKYGIYVINSKNIKIINNNIINSHNKAVVVMGDNINIQILNNYISGNNHGAIFLNGNISESIVENNLIYDNKGAENLTAGIVLSSIQIENYNTPYNEHRDIYLYDLDKSPNNNIIKNNEIKNGNSSGIYSDGGYMNYILDNTIENNDKEGICLDYGTLGTYVNNNRIIMNGGRYRQSDDDLNRDFISEFGRLDNGSSPAKLPGISIDNAAYNIIRNNSVKQNYGSGVKVVRTGVRNIIINNIIEDNNLGKSDKFHFFGIELGHAVTPDKPVKGLDFTASFENIISRNNISGNHYAGIFLAEDCYMNDMFDNLILDSENLSIESLSIKHNNSLNNIGNMPSRGISLSNTQPMINLPMRID